MARKNPFEKVLESSADSGSAAQDDFVGSGASKSISNTLDDLVDKADRLLEGETIIEIEPSLIDPSFLKDRIEPDELEFQALKKAIAEEGQSTPVLVRPHPINEGRYMIVFGAQRRRVAEELGLKVRAVIKEMTDRDHVVAQGQQNAARANLSFIERALMAAAVVEKRYDNDNATVMSALSIDKATLSKMLSVASMPVPILDVLGGARSVGRDRWYELKTIIDNPANKKRALQLIDDETFRALDAGKRFDHLLGALKKSGKPARGIPAKTKSWTPKDKGLEVSASSRGKNFTLAVKANDQRAIEFGEFVSKRLENLYEQFKAETQK